MITRFKFVEEKMLYTKKKHFEKKIILFLRFYEKQIVIRSCFSVTIENILSNTSDIILVFKTPAYLSPPKFCLFQINAKKQKRHTKF